jgi:ABC-type uncharacterized transport system auxiliary subunit
VEVLAHAHVATVSLAASLRDGDGAQFLDRTFTVGAPVAGEDPAMMAEAMNRALDEATTEVVTTVAAAVRAR